MPRKTIMSVMGVDHSDEDLIAAAELARQSGAHLDVIVISRAPQPPMGDIAYSDYAFLWEGEDARSTAKATALRGQLEERGYDGDVQSVYCLTGTISEEVARRAAFADMTVIGKHMLEDASLLKAVLDGALFKSPAPVMLLGGRKPSLAPQTILVAWNSTLEAGASIRHSMDLLVQADEVHVVVVDPSATEYGMGEEPGADIANFLARHDVKVVVDVLASGGRDPALVLQRHAVDIGAELIVMGAYGHTRLRERVFGGTTQTMLDNVTIPVIMAH